MSLRLIPSNNRNRLLFGCVPYLIGESGIADKHQTIASFRGIGSVNSCYGGKRGDRRERRMYLSRDLPQNKNSLGGMRRGCSRQPEGCDPGDRSHAFLTRFARALEISPMGPSNKISWRVWATRSSVVIV
jgi:hypothetical protein